MSAVINSRCVFLFLDFFPVNQSNKNKTEHKTFIDQVWQRSCFWKKKNLDEMAIQLNPWKNLPQQNGLFQCFSDKLTTSKEHSIISRTFIYPVLIVQKFSSRVWRQIYFHSKYLMHRMNSEMAVSKIHKQRLLSKL